MDEAKATDEPIRKNDSGFSFSSTKKYDDYPASLFRQSKTPVDGVKFDTNGEDDDFENIKLDSKPSSSHDIADARVKSPTNDMGRHGSYHPNKLAKSGSKAKIHVTPNNTSVTHHSSSPSKKNEQRNGASKCAIIGLIILGILAALLAALLSHMVTKNNCPIGFPNHTLVLDDRFGPDFFKNTTVVDEEEEKFLKIDGPTAEELKLPTNLKPDWYDLKIKTYLPGFVEISEEKNLTFDGDLSIKFHVIKETKEIVLNADQLTFDLDVENYKLLKVVPSKKDEGRFKREATTPETHHTTQEIQTTTSGSVATTILIDTTTEIDNNVQTDQINAATIALEETTALPSTQSVISTTEENVHNILETSKTDQLKHTTLSLPHETVEENIILEETVDSGIKFVKIAVNETLKKVVFHLSDILKQGDQYILVLKYKGIINNHLSGLYATKYTSNHKTQFAAISQMEPADARQMVVCFDEPSFKAKWRVSIIHPAGSRAISNGMEVKDGVDTEDKNWKLTTFKETLPMSSYLLTVVICNFTFIEGFTKTGIRFRVWSRPEAIHQTKYALETGIKVIEFYEEYFDEPFPMSKICMVAIPDFSMKQAGAMEGFGLITYRETEILYDPKVQYPFQKMRVATVIAHECAHQWFGDLTTMYDFQSLWLNEGFASFLEFIGTDAVSDNAFRQDEYFVISALDYAMEADAKATSHPLNFPIEKAEDALQVFDTITYERGASFIRMLQFVVGEDNFKKGLQYYIKKHKYNNTVPEDLWEALQTSVPKDLKAWDQTPFDVKAFSSNYIDQMGYPVVYVRRLDENSVELLQKRFKIDDKTVEDKKFRYLQKETEYLPWIMAIDGLKMIAANFGDDPELLYFNQYYSSLLKPLFDSVDWNELDTYLTDNKQIFENNLKATVVNEYCKVSIDDCTQKTLNLFKNSFIDKCNEKDSVSSECSKVPVMIRKLVYSNGVRYGTSKEYEFVVDRFMNESVQAEQLRLLDALGCSKNTITLKKMLNDSMVVEDGKYRMQDIGTLMRSVGGDFIGKRIIFEWLIDNWPKIYKTLKPQHSLMNSLINNALQIHRTSDIALLESFLHKYASTTSKYDNFKQNLETAKQRADWREKHMDGLAEWFSKHSDGQPE